MKNTITKNELAAIMAYLNGVKQIAMRHYDDNHDFFTIFYHDAEALQNDAAALLYDKTDIKELRSV